MAKTKFTPRRSLGGRPTFFELKQIDLKARMAREAKAKMARAKYEKDKANGLAKTANSYPLDELQNTLDEYLGTPPKKGKKYKEADDPHVKWDPAEKEKELFDRRSRYILLETSNRSELAAFCMFRFEADENHEGRTDYEMQVSKKFQGLGVCRSVFDALERLSSEFEVQLIMLTVFKCNLEAIAVYEHLEYKEHVDTTNTLLVLHKTISKPE
ncbi:hypothetical protein FRC09_019146 [Ceratobasidium sp. 395]|nr:hypothetical protein FRC09_019146 [Ceratobasidium sp. 395]